MAVEKEIIVAIEFGSSKIRGMAGCKNIDGSVQVLDVEQVDARNCIRKGVVYNVEKTVMCLRHIVEKMETALGMRLCRAFVGIGGRSLKGKINTVSRQLVTKTVISQELVDSATMKAKQILSQAEEKAANIEKDAEKKITKQIITYNYLKDEIEAFKNRVSENIHKQLDLLSQIPRENKNIEKRATEQQAQDTQTAQSEQETSLQTEPSASTVDNSEPQQPISGTQITL